MRQSSSVSGFTTASRYQQAAQSSISNFTAGPSALPDQPSRFTSVERETTKGMDAETSIASIGGAYTDFEGITSSIADRAKTRQRPTKPPAPILLDVIELTSEDEDDELNIKLPQPKAKPKSKSKPKPKTKAIEIGKAAAPSPVAPDTSMHIEQPKPPALPRPRPRPRPRVPRPPAPADQSRDSVTTFPLTTPPSGGPELPIATSPPRVPATSQLPPSDPPIPSISTAYNDDPRARAPPIEFLPDGPLSSPDSLFNENAASNKRKRTVPELDELDELAASQEIPERVLPTDIYRSSPRGMQPPSTFFAGSSSSSMWRDREAAAAPGANPSIDAPEPLPPRDVVDLTMLPPTMVPQHKAKKKKVDLSMYEGSEQNKMLVLDEDDRDDDFDPDGEGSSKKKKGKAKAKDKDKPAKSRAKPKPATDTADPPGKGKGKLEVVLDTRPQSKAGAKTKSADKGKQKSAAANKEVFKSSEFIEDSEDELASIDVAGSSGGIIRVSTASAPTTASSHKQPIQAPRRSPSPLSDWDSDMPKAGPSDKRASGPKKRKSIVDSDGDDDEYTGDAGGIVRVTPLGSSKKRKTEETPSRDKAKSKSEPKTGKNIVISEDEQDGMDGAQDEVAVKSHKSSTGSKASRKIIPDEDENNGVDEPPKSTKAQQAAAGETPKATKVMLHIRMHFHSSPLTHSTGKCCTSRIQAYLCNAGAPHPTQANSPVHRRPYTLVRAV